MPVSAVIEIEKDPSYFHCGKLSAWMTKKSCIKNQELARQAIASSNGRVPAVAYDRQYSCSDCTQGKQIEEEMMKLKHPCKLCGEHEAITLKNGEPILHGMCVECYTKKNAEAKERNQYIYQLDFFEQQDALEEMKLRAKAQLRDVKSQLMWDILTITGQL
jgi:hypothetical protein